MAARDTSSKNRPVSEGYLYILFNPSFRENCWKIGRTIRSPEQRARELSSSTGVPEPFEVAFKVRVRDCARAEASVHRELDEHRVPGREFFVIDLDQAIRVLIRAAGMVGLLDGAFEDTDGPAIIREEESPKIAEAAEVDFVMGASVGRRRLSRGKEVPIEDHLRKLTPGGRRAFYALQAQVLLLDPDIEELSCQPYVRYRRARNFAEITFHARERAMKVWINQMSYDDPQGLIETYNGSVDWRLKSYVWLSKQHDVGYAVSLVRESMGAIG